MRCILPALRWLPLRCVTLSILLLLGADSPSLQAALAPAVFMIGDSTMADKSLNLPEWGWGQALRRFFVDPAIVQNHAKNGRSTKSFIDEGLWKIVRDQLQPGDYVIIQFAHNDEKPDLARATDPATTFRENLAKFVHEAREKGALPVLATPVCRRKFDDQGKLIPTHGMYPEAVRAVATAENVPLLDLERATQRWLEEAGPIESRRFFMWLEPDTYRAVPKGARDDTHFVEEGATAVAGLAIGQMRELNLPFLAWLKSPHRTKKSP